MVTLTAVVPATNDPPPSTRASTRSARQTSLRRRSSSSPRRRPCGGAERVSRTRKVTSSSSSTRTCPAHRRVRTHPRRVRGGSGRWWRSSAPTTTCRPIQVSSRSFGTSYHHVHQQGAGEATTFWAGLGNLYADAFRAAGGFDADRYPLPSVEDIDPGTRLQPRRQDPPRPADPGHAPEALDASGHGAHGLLAARRAMGGARAAPRLGRDGAESRLAPSRERGGGRDLGARGLARQAGDGAGGTGRSLRSTSSSMSSSCAGKGRQELRRGRACTRCTT